MLLFHWELVAREKKRNEKDLKLKQILVTIVLLIATGVAAAAPTINDRRPSVGDWLGGMGSTSVGLIDPSKLTINHGMSFGASFGGGNSLMSGLYQTNLMYRLSNPLTFSLSLGLQNLRYGNSPTAQNSVIAGFGIDYKPTKNFQIMLRMQQVPFGTYLNNSVSSNANGGTMGSSFLQP